MTTQTGQQPTPPMGRPSGMTPLEIACHRLRDFAQGADPNLFDRTSAAHVYNRLAHLEEHYDSLRRAAGSLLDTLNPVQLTGAAGDLVDLARVIDLTAEELHQP